MTGGLRPVSLSWCQVPWDLRPLLFFNWTLAVIVHMQHPLWREDGSIIYNCCWPSPAQSFSGLIPAGLITIFYCLRFKIPSTWKVRSPYLYPRGRPWPNYIPRHWVPFSSPPTTRRATVEVFEPASTGGTDSLTKLSQSQSYVTTDGQSASLYWNKAPI
jgi:hypothetical protein